MSSTAARKGSARTSGRPPLDEPPAPAGATLVPDDARVILPGSAPDGRPARRALRGGACRWPVTRCCPRLCRRRLQRPAGSGSDGRERSPAAPSRASSGDEPERAAPRAAKPIAEAMPAQEAGACREHGLDARPRAAGRPTATMSSVATRRRRARLGGANEGLMPGRGSAATGAASAAPTPGAAAGAAYVWNGARRWRPRRSPASPARRFRGWRCRIPTLTFTGRYCSEDPILILRCICPTVPVPYPVDRCDTTIWNLRGHHCEKVGTERQSHCQFHVPRGGIGRRYLPVMREVILPSSFDPRLDRGGPLGGLVRDGACRRSRRGHGRRRRNVDLRDGAVVSRARDPDAHVDVGRRHLHRHCRRRLRVGTGCFGVLAGVSLVVSGAWTVVSAAFGAVSVGDRWAVVGRLRCSALVGLVCGLGDVTAPSGRGFVERRRDDILDGRPRRLRRPRPPRPPPRRPPRRAARGATTAWPSSAPAGAGLRGPGETEREHRPDRAPSPAPSRSDFAISLFIYAMFMGIFIHHFAISLRRQDNR